MDKNNNRNTTLVAFQTTLYNRQNSTLTGSTVRIHENRSFELKYASTSAILLPSPMSIYLSPQRCWCGAWSPTFRQVQGDKYIVNKKDEIIGVGCQGWGKCYGPIKNEDSSQGQEQGLGYAAQKIPTLCNVQTIHSKPTDQQTNKHRRKHVRENQLNNIDH